MRVGRPWGQVWGLSHASKLRTRASISAVLRVCPALMVAVLHTRRTILASILSCNGVASRSKSPTTSATIRTGSAVATKAGTARMTNDCGPNGSISKPN